MPRIAMDGIKLETFFRTDTLCDWCNYPGVQFKITASIFTSYFDISAKCKAYVCRTCLKKLGLSVSDVLAEAEVLEEVSK